jgi:hypothetical protein
MPSTAALHCNTVTSQASQRENQKTQRKRNLERAKQAERDDQKKPTKKRRDDQDDKDGNDGGGKPTVAAAAAAPPAVSAK